MIDRFNFYDIYGYLLPGTLLFGMFWLPFGIIWQKLPTSDISGALLLLVPTYIAGHLLRTVADVIISSNIPDHNKKLRVPSNILLDRENGEFSPEFKDNLGRMIKGAFCITSLDKDVDRTRAFFAARAYLIRNKAAVYLEQFEGMYVMMRGLTCAFYLGCAYLAGWVLALDTNADRYCFGADWVIAISVVVALIASVAAQYIAANPAAEENASKQQKIRKVEAHWILAVCSMLFVASVGYFLGRWATVSSTLHLNCLLLWALPVTLIAGMRCLQAYRGFAQDFAKTVWRDFAGLYGDKKKQDDDDSV